MVSLLGDWSWFPGDEVFVYWSTDGKPLYAGFVIETNGDVSRVKFGDGDESWITNEYIHKKVVPEDRHFNV